ncbi:MipA/OmpV family protein [Klebsiella michiganensis]|nr:MipA/OmpV family protein [Klebsiella michiganensis]
MDRRMLRGGLLAGVLLCTGAMSAEISGFAGLGASVAPLYSGSSRYAPGPLLTAGVTWRSQDFGTFALTSNDFNWDPAPNSPFSMSLQVTSDGGRKETINSPFSARKNHDLRGMGDLPATVMAGVRLRYRQDGWSAWANALTATQKRHYGGEALGNPVTASSGAEMTLLRWHDGALAVGGDITWASRGYLQGHYGISARQAAQTGFPPYSSSAGWQNGGVYSELTWHLTDLLSAGFNGRVEYLFSEPGKSPLVRSRVQYTLSSLLLYSF